MYRGEKEEFYSELGKTIRQFRELQPNLTQEKLARLTNLSRTSISNIEQGRQHLSAHQLVLFARSLGVKPDTLLPSEASNSSNNWVEAELPPDTDPKLKEWAATIGRSVSPGRNNNE